MGLVPSLISARGHDLPLYRRIAPPGLDGLFFAGFVDAPGGLLPVVETKAEWIAAVLTGRLPWAERIWQAIGRPERRTRQRFPGERPQSIRCDPHAYRRLLRSDLRRARRVSVVRSRIRRGRAGRVVHSRRDQGGGPLPLRQPRVPSKE